MEKLEEILEKLKTLGTSGIKISFEDEGALLNEVLSMRQLTSKVGMELSIKIGGCEAKREIADCIHIGCDSIVAPMVESEFALKKFLKAYDTSGSVQKKGFNLETIQGYDNLDELSKHFVKSDFVTVGRVDFAGSMNKDRTYVDSDDMYEKIKVIFKKVRENGSQCYMGGAVSVGSKDFIKRLIDEKLLDKFETRYIIYDVNSQFFDFDNFEKLLYWGNVFEVEWLKYIQKRYLSYGNKDDERIKMIEQRIAINTME